MTVLRPVLAGALLTLLVGSAPVFADASRTTPAAASTALAAHPPGAVIASAHDLATQAGLRIIAQGGNAFDAAVAVASTLGVVEPESSGIGGGDFYLLHDGKTGKDVFVDAREVAPAAVKASQYLGADGKLDHDKALDGALSAGIPGAAAGWVYVARHYGRLPLKQDLAPAIAIARGGFPVYARMVSEYAERQDVMRRWPATTAIYEPQGKPLAVDDVLKQPDLAATLQALADHGDAGFYRGEVAKKIVAAVNAAGGHWTADDLAHYEVKLREPLVFDYRGWHIVTAPPPSSGGVALAEMLNILSAWDLKKLDAATRVHLIVEAMRRAYRDRTFFLGDPDFVKDMPIARLTSMAYADQMRAGIAMDKATPSSSLPGAPPPHVGKHTTHFSIIDREGNYVAATLTVNTAYGSGLVAAGTGVLLNDEMDDFALQAGVPNVYGVIGYDANAVKPGKRPLSSMSPTFMLSPDKVVLLGSSGGSRIITNVMRGILGFDDGLTPQQVVTRPHFHHQYLPDEIMLEPQALSDDVVARLRAMGYTLSTRNSTWGIMQAVEWDRRSNTLSGGSDPRNPVGSARVQLQEAKP
ncbi:MAG: gamma-glutamyltransferase [Proteobacteria bacterium]|nr:gamma-glutamyltransferase [Pseudomonadota bacterium]